jgi:hypothetical protein
MANRIKDMSLSISRLTPAEAEINITVFPEALSSATLARGRVVGPRCAYAVTVEIAYPFREQARHSTDPPSIVLRALIPEPCLWDPESPFVYRCHVELWQDGQPCDERSMDYGLARPK